MSILVVPDANTEYRLVNNAIQSLSGADKVLTRQADLAFKLAIMFVATSRVEDAERLLDSVIEYAKYDGDESRWGSFGACIALRSHLARKRGETRLSDRLMGKIAANEIMAVERGRDVLAAEILEEHDEEFATALSWTPTLTIDALSVLASEHLYLIESHESIYNDLSNSDLERIKAAYDQCVSEVAAVLG